MRKQFAAILAFWLACVSLAFGQGPKQPRVTPGPSEPDWVAILDALYGLRMFDDLANPVTASPTEVPGRFRKAGDGPVVYTPLMALGLEVTIHGGWYVPGEQAGSPILHEVWHYQFRNTASDIETGKDLPPPLAEGSKTEFDPADQAFGLWVGNDQFQDKVFSQPREVAAGNARLAAQPYKAMIYPYRDKATGKVVPHSFLIGWEYSTNDDFQDVVCRIDNVELIPVP